MSCCPSHSGVAVLQAIREEVQDSVQGCQAKRCHVLDLLYSRLGSSVINGRSLARVDVLLRKQHLLLLLAFVYWLSNGSATDSKQQWVRSCTDLLRESKLLMTSTKAQSTQVLVAAFTRPGMTG